MIEAENNSNRIARNPTGQAIVGDDLKELVQLSRDKVTLIMDEFYSW
jgi:aspartate/methionine/tyrosine aminotransferase